MASVENLKVLETYEDMKKHHIDVSIIAFIDSIIIRIKQKIIEEYIWTEEEIIKKIMDDINPEAISMYFV